MNKNSQAGQALIVALVFIAVASLSMVFVYNTGQLLADRMTAKSLADHAAYSMAVEQARLLNLNAYINRAQVANQLSIAQNISIASYGMMFTDIPRNSGPLNLIPGYAPVINGISKVMQYGGQALATPIIADAAVSILLQGQQSILFAGADINLYKVAPTIIDESNAGQFEAQYIPGLTTINLLSFLHMYTGKERDRMKKVLDESVLTGDPFTRARKNKDITFPFPTVTPFGLVFTVFEKRGGTELIGLDEWKGKDTFSMHFTGTGMKKCGSKWFRYPCPDHMNNREVIPIGYGSAAVFNNKGNGGDNPNVRGFDTSLSINPKGSRLADDQHVTPYFDSRKSIKAPGYGVPIFVDLKDTKTSTAIFKIAVRVSKKSKNLLTTQHASQFKVSSTLESPDNLAADGIVTASQSEVYFERADGQPEKASLFNPYWRARVVPTSIEVALAAKALP